MRTREVELAIRRTGELRQYIKEYGKDTRFADNENAIIAYETLGTVLSYIYELEKDSLYWRGKYHLLTREINVIPKEDIRAKIKELEENPNNPYQKVMASQIDASLISCLKEILGEEYEK